MKLFARVGAVALVAGLGMGLASCAAPAEPEEDELVDVGQEYVIEEGEDAGLLGIDSEEGEAVLALAEDFVAAGGGCPEIVPIESPGLATLECSEDGKFSYLTVFDSTESAVEWASTAGRELQEASTAMILVGQGWAIATVPEFVPAAQALGGNFLDQ